MTLFAQRTPRLTIAIIVDQLSYAKLMELRPYLKGGIHEILEHGLVYHNAYQQHGMPSTATGHAALSTGTYASAHGITGNNWHDSAGKKVVCDDDSTQSSAVFAVDGMHDYGKSPHNLMVDTITDQFMLASKPFAQHTAYSISLKSRSAILTAGKLGKALWFDPQSGWFTSSKAYFETLPQWLVHFNKKKQLNTIKDISWQRAYKARDYPYRMFKDKPESMQLFSKTIPIDHSQASPYTSFLQTPAANRLVFELARTCVDTHLSKKPDDKILLWICPSALDHTGHEFGPNSIHITDLIYHLDLELFRLYKHVTKHIRKKDVLVLLTSDHGMGSSPEEMYTKGYPTAQRILTSKLQDALNIIAYDQSGYTDMIVGIKAPNIFFDVNKLNALSKAKRNEVLDACKQYLIAQPGIKDVWTAEELQKRSFEPTSLALYFKNQLYHGRNGQLIVQPDPYCFLTRHTTGASHKSPYNYDTHVPLIIYQVRSHERANIYSRTNCMQCAPTLSHLLGIPKPSATTQALLPGIVPTNDPCF